MAGIETTRLAPTLAQLQRAVCVALICSAIACGPVANLLSDAPIITRYRDAVCVPFSTHPQVTPHTREWSTTLTLRNGTKVLVSGAQIPGGRVVAFYPAEHRDVVAANPGDYIYPSDVRLDAQNDLLYVKAHGLAGGLTEQTWFFEYDLRGQRMVQRLQVKNGALPAECSDTSHPQ
jgi:hypothetical protein